VDAVVIGSGVNGLVAAAELARSGWSVAIVERNPRIGGFVESAELTRPGFIHDTYSSWHSEFVTGGAYAVLGEELHRHGLEYRNAEGFATGTVRRDGSSVLAHRDPGVTADGFADSRDREAYLSVLDRTREQLPQVGALLGGELRSLRSVGPVGRLGRAGGAAGLDRLLRDVASSGRAWVRRTFAGDEVDSLWVPWLLHSGLSPDHASGAVMLPLFAATIHAAGLPVVAGGSARFLTAFDAVLAEHGVEVHCGTPAERILVRGGRAVGVGLADGTTIDARRAVLASVAPGALYGELLPADAVPEAVARDAARFRAGRAAMQIHVALSAPPPWRDARLAEVPLLHLSEGSASTAIACAEAEAGLLPREATVVVGQQTALDPSRAPAGAATLWIQLQELPARPVGDAAGALHTGGRWTPELAEAYAERILRRVDSHAPGLLDRVLAKRVLTPDDLTAHNPNAIGGDPYGGSPELDQRLLWRPLPSSPRHSTPVRGLWHIGAATHPGPGLNAASGHLVAQTLLRPAAGTAAARAIRGAVKRARG